MPKLDEPIEIERPSCKAPKIGRLDLREKRVQIWRTLRGRE